MKTDTVFKKAFNDALDLVSKLEDREPLPSENTLSARLGVSRTTVRKVLAMLAARGLVAGSGSQRTIRQTGAQMRRFPQAETIPMADQVEGRFMEWMLRDNASPGTTINELDLARRFGVATTGIREFLNRFQRFGLIEKRPNSGWLFKGFTEEFALELFEVRMMFELRSARLFIELPASSPHWGRLDAIERQHFDLLDNIETRFHDFSALDSRFHTLVAESSPNRFIDDFAGIITFIFHYHYQWNKADEKARNEAALVEHLNYIKALRSRERGAVDRACRIHLNSARNTLLRSLAPASRLSNSGEVQSPSRRTISPARS